jgi:ADP-ribosyl-[dinitrogen reductase] hydrolase
MNKDKSIDILLGVAIGDALGVPVEFKNRNYLKVNPITDMIGFGTHNQPAGTWSDDSSLTFCLTEALIEGYTIEKSANNLLKWYTENYWTADGDVFDIGNTTLKVIIKLKNGVRASESGLTTEQSNGNGSLMRMSPLIIYLKDEPIETRFKIIKEESSITHAHMVSVIACFYFVEFGIGLLNGKEKFEVYKELQKTLPAFLITQSISEKEIKYFERLLVNNINEDEEEIIFSTGYVIHTLTASIWSILNTNSFEEAVLKAVNLGEDTDTTASVVGALAGLVYSQSQMPEKWINTIKRKDDIIDLGNRLFNSMKK